MSINVRMTMFMCYGVQEEELGRSRNRKEHRRRLVINIGGAKIWVTNIGGQKFWGNLFSDKKS